MEQQVRNLLPNRKQYFYGWSQHLFLRFQGFKHPLLDYTEIKTHSTCLFLLNICLIKYIFITKLDRLRLILFGKLYVIIIIR